MKVSCLDNWQNVMNCDVSVDTTMMFFDLISKDDAIAGAKPATKMLSCNSSKRSKAAHGGVLNSNNTRLHTSFKLHHKASKIHAQGRCHFQECQYKAER
mmetsp:Transcript_21201/g.55144  ORF Transcript_21201/g.55144 Transcript_21201/m.55144 type:complete len:99 (-) Transcript_21201:1379-1675(-)